MATGRSERFPEPRAVLGAGGALPARMEGISAMLASLVSMYETTMGGQCGPREEYGLVSWMEEW